MRKAAFCICENKDADQLRGNREADQRLCFRYTYIYFLSTKFQACSHLVWFYSLVCVGPCRKPRSSVFSQRGFRDEVVKLSYSLCKSGVVGLISGLSSFSDET